MTINPPNSSVPDNALCGTVANNDPLMPCTNGSTTARVNTARSRHTGGVNAMFCDGSVRFFSNSTSTATWQAMGSMDFGDIVPN
jgi:prepilin-type processing-associated H-X9-DG protein